MHQHSFVSVALLALPLLAFSFAKQPDETAEAPPKAPVVEVPIHPNNSCPIMGKPISTRLFVDTAKGRFWVCCKSCYEEILADLDTAHRSAYPEVRVLSLEHCPVTDEPLPEEPHRAIVQGFDVPLCCAPCEAQLLKDSQIHLALLADPELEDLRNPRCPITDEPVAPNGFCQIDQTLVRLSSPRALDDVRADPAAALAKARASVAEHGALARPKCPEREARETQDAAETSGDAR